MILRYSLFLAVGITLPGVLLWRALRRNVDGFVADVSFGTGLGLALSIGAYVPARAAGVPLLALAFPVLTTAVFTLPRLRRHWRSHGPGVPLWWSCWTAAACVVGFAAVMRSVAREALRFPRAAFQYVDMPYHLSLAGELKHHFPGQIPYVVDEPLHYHWFVYAHLASASWQTGIELDVLLRRLLPVTATIVTVVAVAALATRLARHADLAWAGPLAAWLVVMVSSFDVYGWNGTAAVAQNSFANGVQIYSPTHAFGLLIAVPAAWVIADLLHGSSGNGGTRHRVRGSWSGWGDWALLALVLVGLSGAKASFIPLFCAGLVLALTVRLVTARRLDPTTVALTGVTVATVLFAQLVLFGGSSAGTAIEALKGFRAMALALHFPGQPGRFDASAVATVSTMATALLSWGMVGVGMVGFARRSAWRDPVAAFVVGCLLAGLGATVLLFQHGASQYYFVRAAFPIAAAGSAWGLALLLRNVPYLLPRLATAFGLGIGLSFAVSALNEQAPDAAAGDGAVLWRTTWPWLLTIGLVAATALLGRRFAPGSRLPALGLVVLLGASSVLTPARLAAPEPARCQPVNTSSTCGIAVRRVPWQGEAAARFIRAHSTTDQVLATNSHCTPVYERQLCESRNFWLSAYSERRVLLHGWAYTPTANGRAGSALEAFYGKFWDPELKFANDVVFTKPTSWNLRRLRDTYGVRWLVVDRNVNPPPDALRKLARKRFDSGAIVVYEIGPRPETSG